MLELASDKLGDGPTVMLIGGAVGLAFGAAAQHSRFCLRAATAEIARRRAGPQFIIWLIVFFTALTGTQLLSVSGRVDLSEARQLSGAGSLSGAIIGGVLFGVGMVLARGCASRILVLSATGNLRALIAGLVLTVAAQASLRGVLAPLREAAFGLWTLSGAGRDLLSLLPSATAVLLVAGAGGVAALAAGLRARMPVSRLLSAMIVGGTITAGWMLTHDLAGVSFEPVALASVTFTGPSTDTFMGLVNAPTIPLSFSTGLVPGVFIGAGAMAVASGEFRIRRFDADHPMERYVIGAVLMGFGSMLAGGCAVGAGVSGGALLATTAWVALVFMWVGSVATHCVLASLETRRIAV